MKKSIIFEAKDGEIFNSNHYPNIEAAENACRNHEAMIDYIGTDVILLDYDYDKVTNYKKADFIIFKNDKIKQQFVEYFINPDEVYDKDYFNNGNYFLLDLEDDCWIDVEANCEMWQKRLEKLKQF